MKKMNWNYAVKKLNLYRYCPEKKDKINRVKCIGCLFCSSIQGDTNLYKVRCYYNHKLKRR